MTSDFRRVCDHVFVWDCDVTEKNVVYSGKASHWSK